MKLLKLLERPKDVAPIRSREAETRQHIKMVQKTNQIINGKSAAKLWKIKL